MLQPQRLLTAGTLANPSHYDPETRQTSVWIDDASAFDVKDAHKCGGMYCRDIPLGWYIDDLQMETFVPVVVVLDQWDNDDEDETETYILAAGYREPWNDGVLIDLDSVVGVTDYSFYWHESDAAISLAHEANSVAERAAEREREYQRALTIREDLLPSAYADLSMHRRDAIKAQLAGLDRLATGERCKVRAVLQEIRDLREELIHLPQTEQ